MNICWMVTAHQLGTAFVTCVPQMLLLVQVWRSDLRQSDQHSAKRHCAGQRLISSLLLFKWRGIVSRVGRRGSLCVLTPAMCPQLLFMQIVTTAACQIFRLLMLLLKLYQALSAHLVVPTFSDC